MRSILSEVAGTTTGNFNIQHKNFCLNHKKVKQTRLCLKKKDNIEVLI